MELNEKNIRKIRWLIIFTVAVVVVGFNYRSVFFLFGRLFRIASPFLLGAVIAFILNVPMRRIEKLLPFKGETKLKRPVSLVLTLVFVAGILLLVVLVVMPELLNTILGLQSSLPAFINKVQAGLNESLEILFAAYPETGGINDFLNTQIDWKSVLENIFSFLSSGAGTVLSSTVSAAVSIVSGFTSFGIALIFSFYILLQKEILSRQGKKFLYAFLPDRMSGKVLDIMSLAETTFSSFLTGQCMEAVILGTMFFITMTLLRLPYALLIGVLIAFTALIPIFGAFIGCAIGIFLMLMVNPMDALIFTVVFFVLQQIEGNLIYPHVVGNSVGLPSIWVLVAVTVGGSAMGIVGMLIFIPLSSVLYSLLRDVVNERTEKKRPPKTAKQTKS